MKLEDINVEELADLVAVANESIAGIINAIDPRDYKDKHDFFISVVLTAPAMIAASIIEKVRGTFNLDSNEVLEAYIEKTKLALKWEIHKETLKYSGIN